MAKRNELIAATARSLGDPPQSINVLAMELGKAKLIRVTGRGLSAADMQVSDAVSLLTSAMSGGYSVETGKTTRRVLSAFSCVSSPTDPKLSNGFDFQQDMHTFGQAFESLLDAFVKEGVPVEQTTGQRIEGVTIAVETLPVAYECRIHLGARHRPPRWKLTYWAYREELEHLLPDQVVAVEAELKNKYGRKTVSVSIDEGVLSEIAAVLRGDKKVVPYSTKRGA